MLGLTGVQTTYYRAADDIAAWNWRMRCGVEDDAIITGLMLAAQTRGYACDGVSTARAAEHSLESGHYSLMVLDLGLPDEDESLHFLTRIRQKNTHPAGTHS